jgi:hypothetical protein
LRLCNRFFRSFASLFYLCLCCGALVSCHLLRAFLYFFFAIFFTIIGRPSLEFCSFPSGVACHAAFLITLIMFSTASIPTSVLRVSPRLLLNREFL